ncbi:putative shikimate-5-dehydrogenase (AroE) [Rhodococcoides trifolii]|uniref:Shikimate-5-dehydrogenase (AroE) n=1 Tax=Rhodococcoides trifolii TaxID=908250 RepID=A0A917D2T5_9NOCA|nr:shikimate dehydrogenase [Rhodococcus trifolii]GGG09130.1 putative shikimate-5-dehydrogenase (AroE) [Rhodococcus trifolii]
MIGARRAAVLGSPIAHSKSPVLHGAAYDALGLTGWTYERIECTGDRLPGLVGSLGAEWVGLSVTMPNKIAALEFATERTTRAEVVGSANTLVRIADGWRADCTDVDGVTGALADAGVTDLDGETVVVVGAGGTARPSLVALASLGARSVRVVARSADRAQGAIACGRAVGLDVTWTGFDAESIAAAVFGCAAVISTVPAEAAAPLAESLARTPLFFDAIYDPWPTPVAQAVSRAGGVVVGGLAMLLNQAYGQVEQFTGMPAPRHAMADALADAVR